MVGENALFELSIESFHLDKLFQSLKMEWILYFCFLHIPDLQIHLHLQNCVQIGCYLKNEINYNSWISMEVGCDCCKITHLFYSEFHLGFHLDFHFEMNVASFLHHQIFVVCQCNVFLLGLETWQISTKHKANSR